MTWLIAVVLRPFAALALFGLAAFLAICVLKPLFPEGRVKAMLYDRTLRKRHPVRFGLIALASYVALGLLMLGVWNLG